MTHDVNDSRLADELIEGSDLTSAEARELSLVVEMIRGGASEGPLDDGFNSRLRSRLEAEMCGVSSDVATRVPGRRVWRFAVLSPLVAAAVVTLVLLWPGNVAPPTKSLPGTVWADVVRAMERVGQFHMIAFVDDPRSADAEQKLMRIDLFYREPNRWRAQGMGFVQFRDEQMSRTYGVKERKFLGEKDRKPDILPTSFIDRFHADGMLPAILTTVFRGDVPVGEVVRSDEVSDAAGIEVFDYIAGDAAERWARIWVLRESKLPLRIHVHYPGSDEFVLVTFDYSDPQEEGFFDSVKFEAAAKELGSNDPARVYSIGSRPVGGATTKPRSSAQIYETQGGYRVLVIQRVGTDAEGAVVIVTDNPDNRTPKGYRPAREGFERVKDSWGNTYAPAGRISGLNGVRKHYFVPIGTFKQGETPRTLDVWYVLQEEHGGQPAIRIASTLNLPVAGEGKGEDWKHLTGRDRWIQQFLSDVGTLEQKLAEIERRLAVDPLDIAALAWRVMLFREHGREEAAWELFEAQVKERLLNDALSVQSEYVLLSQYLLRLNAQGRTDELKTMITRINGLIEEAKPSRDREVMAAVEWLTRVDNNPLQQAMRLPHWRKHIEEHPPIVDRVVRSEDGYAFVELTIPSPPEGWNRHIMGFDGEAPLGWFWQMIGGERNRPVARMADVDGGKLWVVFKVDGERLRFSSTATLIADNYGFRPVRNDATYTWAHEAAMPAATVGEIVQFWAQQASGKKAAWYGTTAPSTQPAKVTAEDWMNEAHTLREAGEYEKAIGLYERALIAPAEQWPEWVTHPANGPDQLAKQKRQIQASMVACHASLGRFEEARKGVAELAAMVPAGASYNDYVQSRVLGDVLMARLNLVRGLIRERMMDEAAQEMKAIALTRPGVADVEDGMQMLEFGSSRRGWWPRGDFRTMWRAYDTLWWEMQDTLGR